MSLAATLKSSCTFSSAQMFFLLFSFSCHFFFVCCLTFPLFLYCKYYFSHTSSIIFLLLVLLPRVDGHHLSCPYMVGLGWVVCAWTAWAGLGCVCMNCPGASGLNSPSVWQCKKSTSSNPKHIGTIYTEQICITRKR